MKTNLWTITLLLGVMATGLLQANVARAESDEEDAPMTQKEQVRAIQLRYASLFISGVFILLIIAYVLTKFNQSLKKDYEARRKQAMAAPDDNFSAQGLSTSALWASKPPDPESSADKPPPH